MFLFEKSLAGSRRYWIWIAALLCVILVGFLNYLRVLQEGLAITGLSRDVPWGLFIAQFAFCVGLGASAVVVVLPYYLHNWKVFAKITVLGEILGMVAVFMAMLFIFASMGQPMRVLNVLLYPHPHSLIFWDLSVLSGYVLLNAVITVNLVSAHNTEVPPPRWLKPIIYLSIPWAISIHTVTAFLFSGLAGRSYFDSSLVAPRFLASAFTSGSALLILLVLLLRRLNVFNADAEVVPKLARIVTYCLLINLFLVGVEVFTAFYSGIPEDMKHFEYIFAGLDGNYHFARLMWVSLFLSLSALPVLLVPRWRRNPRLLPMACVFVFTSIWLDKGVTWIVGGFTPSQLGVVTSYTPTWPEWAVLLGIWALGALIITVLYKITLSVETTKETVRASALDSPLHAGSAVVASGSGSAGQAN